MPYEPPKLKCDFCSTEIPAARVRRLHARSFLIVPESDDVPGQVSEGDWAACPDCDELITAAEAGQPHYWDVLLTRSVRKFFEHDPLMAAYFNPGEVREAIGKLHAMFRQNRLPAAELTQ